MNLTWTAHTGTGSMRIAQLPFTSFNNATFAPIFPLLLANIALVSGAVGVLGQVNTNATTANLLIVRSNTVTISQIAMASSGTLIASMVYQTA